MRHADDWAEIWYGGCYQGMGMLTGEEGKGTLRVCNLDSPMEMLVYGAQVQSREVALKLRVTGDEGKAELEATVLPDPEFAITNDLLERDLPVRWEAVA